MGETQRPRFRRPSQALRKVIDLGTATAAVLLSTQVILAGPAHAEEGWNPFRERDAAEARRKAKAARRAATANPDAETGEQGQPSGDPAGNETPRYAPPPPAGTPVFGDNNAVQRKSLAPLAPPAVGAPDYETNAARPGTPAGAETAVQSTPNQPGPQRRADPNARAAVWKDLDARAFAALIAQITLPVRSWSLRPTWLQLMTSEAASDSAEFAAVRVAALYRSGALRESRAAAAAAIAAPSLIVRFQAARSNIALGVFDEGCGQIKRVTAQAQTLPEDLRGQSILFAGYCAARAGRPSGASLAAQLAREAGLKSPVTIALLEQVGQGIPGGAPPKATLTMIDMRLLQLLPGALSPADVERMSLPATVAIAIDRTAPPALRIAAAERAAGAGVLSVADLKAAYASVANLRVSDPATDQTRRGRLWQAIERERAIYQHTRDIRALLDQAKRAGFYAAALRLAASIVPEIKPVAEVGWFSETAIESAIAAGRLDLAQRWIEFAATLTGPPRGRLEHWRVMIDIAAPRLQAPRGQSLPDVERLALAGRFKPRDLHRLATILDALNYNVPIGLWDAANRTKQPADGHLPETGALRTLADASKARDIARTKLLVMQAIGPKGPAHAHIIALGDSIRALKRAGLEGDARRLAIEALLELWPRTGLDQ